MGSADGTFSYLLPCPLRCCCAGRQSFSDFQTHMRQLLREMLARGPPPPSDRDIGAQLARVLLAARQEAEKEQKGGGKEQQVGRSCMCLGRRGGGLGKKAAEGHGCSGMRHATGQTNETCVITLLMRR